MSGHSKWATIKRAKAKTDAVRGKAFGKISREITTAAKIGGGDAASNPRLRLAIEKSKEVNMPADNVKRAIQKGVGGGEGAQLEEAAYEGYGPAGVAILVQAITDNKQRTVSEIRYIFSRGGGNLGDTGCVSWLFKNGVPQFTVKVEGEEAIKVLKLVSALEDHDDVQEVYANFDIADEIINAFSS